MIYYYTQKLNLIGLLKLNCLLKLLDIKTQATQISFLKTKILKGNNGLIIESRLLIVDKKIHRLVNLEAEGNKEERSRKKKNEQVKSKEENFENTTHMMKEKIHKRTT